ncbi:hypothetical protein GQ44DRAFT_773906 [Phaeosphaeriaceae sp. PMI808]|nr:hypothetical protein GQ44DRAFT_773906 [Phaeosphaeriaceae sp. PMI808]
MIRSESQKENLRIAATEETSVEDGVRLADEETTGENDFKFKKYPDVCGVVVDRGSSKGWVQIQGGQEQTIKIFTGPNETGYAYARILADQSCMPHGYPTVLYAHRKT